MSDKFFDVRMALAETEVKQDRELAGLVSLIKSAIRSRREEFPALRITIEGVDV